MVLLLLSRWRHFLSAVQRAPPLPPRPPHHPQATIKVPKDAYSMDFVFT